MSDNPFAFDSGPRAPRDRRPPRRPPAGGSALPWVLGGLGALVVLAGGGVGAYFALRERPPAPPRPQGPLASGKKSEVKQTEGTKTGARPGGDLPAELVKRARDAMAVIDVRNTRGHHDRGAAFLMADDLMAG